MDAVRVQQLQLRPSQRLGGLDAVAHDRGVHLVHHARRGGVVDFPLRGDDTARAGAEERPSQTDEPFHLFVNRVGPKAFEASLEDLKGAGPVAENMDLYQDWERVGMYVLERGEGECAV